MEKTRSEKLIKSSVWSIGSYIVYVLVGFVSRSVFINRLGEDLTGVSTLFTTILNLLSISEMGFSTAITLHLYRPVAENNHREISALINFYGKVYHTLSVVVLVAGLTITPFVHNMVTSDSQIQHLEFYFVLYVIKSSVGYLFNYKHTLFVVYQEQYVGDRIYYLFLILTTASQAAVIFFTGNYTAYLLIRIAGTFATNAVRTIVADRKYPFLKQYREEKISADKLKEIYSYIKSVAIDKSALMVKTTTDNIFVSKFVNVATTAVVGNYDMFITSAAAVLNIFFASATGGIGNMTVTESKDNQFMTYLDLSFISFWMFGFISTGIACVASSVIENIWLGSARFVLPSHSVLVLCSNMFFMGIRTAPDYFFYALGMVEKVKYRNLVNVLLNIILSLALVFPLGVDGVYLGTIISFLLSAFWLTPYITIKYHFGIQYLKNYIVLYAKGIIINYICLFASMFACSFFAFTGIADVLIKIFICTVVYNSLFALLFSRTSQFKNMTRLAFSILSKYIPIGNRRG